MIASATEVALQGITLRLHGAWPACRRGYRYPAHNSAAREESEMAETGFSSFSTTVDKTNRVLKDIEQAYNWPKERRNQSYAALRSVLHALRDRLTVEETAQLAAELPMLIRGIYYESWHPSRVPVKMTETGVSCTGAARVSL